MNLKPKLLAGFGEINFGKQYRQGNRVYSSNSVAMALNASPVGNTGGYSYLYLINSKPSKLGRKQGLINNKNNNSSKGYELVNFCEFDKYAVQSYCAVHGVDESLNLGDITQVDETQLKPFNMICGGSPCFMRGTKVEVMSDDNSYTYYKNIEDVRVNDLVLSHKHEWRKVLRIGCNHGKKIYKLSICGFEPIYCTFDHPFYVKENIQSEPKIVKLNNIKPTDLFGSFKNRVGYNSIKDNDIYWYEIDSIKETNIVTTVYNLEVDIDHTYTVNDIITKNCQDFSLSGKQAGSKWKCKTCGHEYNPLTVHFSERGCCPECGSEELDKTRSSLLVEWLRIIEANKPDWGIYENVKNLVGKKFKDTFQMFLDELDEYGYNTYYQVLNAKDYGIPQNRERVYVILIKKELDNGQFKFPKPFDNGLRLKDMLDDVVQEQFYIYNDKSKKLLQELYDSGKLDKEFSNAVRGGGEGA